MGTKIHWCCVLVFCQGGHQDILVLCDSVLSRWTPKYTGVAVLASLMPFQLTLSLCLQYMCRFNVVKVVAAGCYAHVVGIDKAASFIMDRLVINFDSRTVLAV